MQAGDVETNPGPTATKSKFVPCISCHDPLYVASLELG